MKRRITSIVIITTILLLASLSRPAEGQGRTIPEDTFIERARVYLPVVR